MCDARKASYLSESRVQKNISFKSTLYSLVVNISIMEKYSFVTKWQIRAPMQQVWDAIYESTELLAWWKGVVDVQVVECDSFDVAAKVETVRSPDPRQSVRELFRRRVATIDGVPGSADTWSNHGTGAAGRCVGERKRIARAVHEDAVQVQVKAALVLELS